MVVKKVLTSCLLALLSTQVWAGAQQEEALSASVQSSMARSIDDGVQPRLVFDNAAIGQVWLNDMSNRLARKIPDEFMRRKLLTSVQYEATRAGLDPQMVLGLINVESGFNRYAISSVGARGLMQVMPFWQRQIGTPQQNLFDMNTNLRYGCTILRHYLDIENGDLFRALGRYNGSLGRPEYPNMVYGAWKNLFSWDQTGTVASR
ncbi:Membrane-bound lytic murein transglycosylase C precursor [Amantichitinum ursilacus]|uniref:Membrane-bound lytic murein transglycosylase C n=1 Tax=Amantichitinum ursilacus TaxID=857265 RepID=A0A0N0XJ17_9NEIS|nr:Membrane-bound lytic murein transglycosylase C precursor [Amantichitinum ursilacus]